MGDVQGPTIRRRVAQGNARRRRWEIRAVMRLLRALPDGVVIAPPEGVEVRMLAAGGAQ